MKGWLPRIAAYLLLGLVTSVAVAWILAGRSGPMLRSVFASAWTEFHFEGVEPPWRGHVGGVHGCTWVMALPLRPDDVEVGPPEPGRPVVAMVTPDVAGPLPRFAVLRRLPADALAALAGELIIEDVGAGRRFRHTHMDVAWGWPARAMRCELRWAPRLIELRGGGRLEVLDGEMVIVPLTPMIAGLGADAVFYAGAWMALVLALNRLRGLMRRAKGVCRLCGYDLRGCAHPHCPECGAAIRAPRSPSQAG